MRVRDIMRSDPVTVPVTADLRVAARKLLARQSGTLTVTREGEPIGLLTETALVKAGCLSNRPFEEIPVKKVMIQSFGSVPPSMPVRAAVRRMNRQRVAAVPVAEGLDVVGSLSARDIARNYPRLIKQATTETAELEETWNSDDQRIEFDS